MKNAVIYARYSSERQTEQSIEGQLRVCNEYAERNGLSIVDNYIDRATTGTNDNRPAFQQMLSDCAKPVVWDIVLVYAIDRFGRNSIEIAVNKQKLHKHNKTLISATQRTSENIDGTKNLDGILLENVYIGLAEYYSAELSQKVQRGMNENREKGHFCGGGLSYGYRVKDKRIIIEENEAEVVKYIFSSYASGKIAKEIIAELTDKGIYLKSKPFKLTTLYGILRKEQYIGIYRHNDKVYTNMYPAIIDKELFDTVQAILAKNKIGSRSAYTDYLLRNVLYCGYCGKHLAGECGTSRNGEVKHYYKCLSRKRDGVESCGKSIVKKDELEELVIDITMQSLNNPETIAYIADGVMELKGSQKDKNSVLNILNEEYSATQKSLDNIMRAIESGIFNETTKNRMAELEEALADLRSKIAAEEYKAKTQLKRDDIIQFLTHGLRQQAKLMINQLIEKIVLYDDKIEIYYRYTDKKNPDRESDRDFLLLSGGSNSYIVVGMSGLEPPTPTLSGWCSNLLSYIPLNNRRFDVDV